MVTADIRRALEDFERVLIQNGVPVERLVLYGSQARGDANEWSDIDVLVVLHLPESEVTRATSRNVWGLSAQCDSRLEPVVCSVDELNSSWRPIIGIAMQEGVDLRDIPRGEAAAA